MRVMRYGDALYEVGDYITVQGGVDYIFTQGEIIIRCSFMEKEGEKIEAYNKRVEAYNYDESKPHIDTTISEIQEDFSAAITSLEVALPRNRLIKTSGYYLEGPSADFGTAVALLQDKAESWGGVIFQGVTCLKNNTSQSEEGIKNGDYVTWWVYFGNNWDDR